ncbi:MAG TPA: hypothetical protein VKN82_02855, partial [Desulfohalobiaceae bacterium]|nr:hypothetical protein [Desulfohalobiaceae bacterium]
GLTYRLTQAAELFFDHLLKYYFYLGLLMQIKVHNLEAKESGKQHLANSIIQANNFRLEEDNHV